MSGGYSLYLCSPGLRKWTRLSRTPLSSPRPTTAWTSLDPCPGWSPAASFSSGVPHPCRSEAVSALPQLAPTPRACLRFSGAPALRADETVSCLSPDALPPPPQTVPLEPTP